MGACPSALIAPGELAPASSERHFVSLADFLQHGSRSSVVRAFTGAGKSLGGSCPHRTMSILSVNQLAVLAVICELGCISRFPANREICSGSAQFQCRSGPFCWENRR